MRPSDTRTSIYVDSISDSLVGMKALVCCLISRVTLSAGPYPRADMGGL